MPDAEKTVDTVVKMRDMAGDGAKVFHLCAPHRNAYLDSIIDARMILALVEPELRFMGIPIVIVRPDECDLQERGFGDRVIPCPWSNDA